MKIITSMVFLLLTMVRLSWADGGLKVSLNKTELSGIFSCKGAEEDLLGLSFHGKYFQVFFPYFSSSHLISKTQACSDFESAVVDYVSGQQPEILELEIDFLDLAEEERVTTPNALRKAYVLKNTILQEICREKGLCKSNVLSFNLPNKVTACNSKFSFKKYFNLIRPKSLKPSYEYIDKVKVLQSPFVPFSEYIKSQIRDSDENFFQASTMNLGNFSGIELLDFLKGARKNLLIAVDSAAMFNMAETSLVEHLVKSQNAFVLPIAPNEEFQSIFHWKVFLTPGRSTSALTSMNIANPYKTLFADYIYEFSNSEVTEELRGLLLSAVKTQCESIEDLDCVLNFKLRTDLKKDWQSIARKACDKVESSMLEFDTPAQKYFMQSFDTDIVYLLVGLIEKAEKEIVVLSHQISEPAVLTALEAARARGVRVRAFTTQEITGGQNLPKDKYTSFQSHFPDLTIPVPHMKLMMFDREEIFFGTGNFTVNALKNSREIFAITKDKEFIETVLRQTASMQHLAFPLASNDFVAHSMEAEIHIIVDDLAIITPEIRSKLDLATVAFAEPWLNKLLKVKPQYAAVLKSCGLGSYQFISLPEFVGCIK